MNKVVVVGASAGGVSALQTLAAGLPDDFPAPMLIVLHIGAHHSVLPELLSRAGPLPAAHARQGEPLEPGRLYIAPPDHHLLLLERSVQLTRGPKQHHARPAIDPLFRSAALSWGRDVIGVILTGMLDDGTTGLQAIKQAGGLAVVQDPDDAVAPSMPESALRHVEVDHCLPLERLPGLLVSLAALPAPSRRGRLPAWVYHQHALLLGEGEPMEHLNALGAPSPYVCPDCQGGLWEVVHSNLPSYACHAGHLFTIRSLQHAMTLAGDEALWGALRALQERALLLRHMAKLQRDAGHEANAERLDRLSEDIEQQTRLMRELVEMQQEPWE